MLEAYYGEWNQVNTHHFTAHSLDELYRLADRLAAARPVSSYRGGMSGDHAWIVLKSLDFSLCVYFGEDCRSEGVVWFHLYGPIPSGPERKHAHPYDGRGLAGRMTMACLKGLLALLDEGRSPVAYLHESALEAEVVTD
jgi:hypothetical protein